MDWSFRNKNNPFISSESPVKTAKPKRNIYVGSEKEIEGEIQSSFFDKGLDDLKQRRIRMF